MLDGIDPDYKFGHVQLLLGCEDTHGDPWVPGGPSHNGWVYPVLGDPVGGS